MSTDDEVRIPDKGGRPRKYENKARIALLLERSLLDAVELVALVEGLNRQAVIQRAALEYIERNHPAALQPGARVTSTISAFAPSLPPAAEP